MNKNEEWDVMIKVFLWVYPPFQQIKVWDVERKKSYGMLRGHAGSVKSLSCHPTNSGKEITLLPLLSQMFDVFKWCTLSNFSLFLANK